MRQASSDGFLLSEAAGGRPRTAQDLGLQEHGSRVAFGGPVDHLFLYLESSQNWQADVELSAY